MENTKEEKIENGYSYNKGGWKYISIKGKPKERGYAYGYLCADDFKDIQKMLNYLVYESYGYSWEYMVEKINKDFKKMTEDEFPELYEEMQGITDGCNANGCKTTLEEIIAWNFYISMSYWFSSVSDSKIGKEGGARDRCSAFIANGDWTEDGKIVVAHNTFTDFVDGQYSYVVLDVNPDKGFRFIMETSPCMIWSGTDFYVSATGIICTETTIGGFGPYEKKSPVGYRIRKAVQYGKTLDDYVDMLLKDNSGDYANSWLFGDTNTNEIMRLELGLKYSNVERTKNGFYIGFNATYDPKIRNIECTNSGFYDIRRHQGARKVRLSDLMDENKGKLNIELAKAIISDHYDVYLKKDNNPCSRTVCSHYELDAREYMSQADRPKPYDPHGAVDGVVCDTNIAKKIGFVGRWGSSCGIAFDKDAFCKEHRQYENFCPYLKNRPSQPWVEFTVDDANTNDVTAKGDDEKNDDEKSADEKSDDEKNDDEKSDTESKIEEDETKKENKKGGRRTFKRLFNNKRKKTIKRKY